VTTDKSPPSAPVRARKRRTILEPPRAWEGLGLKACGEYGGLLGALALRDIRLRYRQTVLGVAWVLLQPLLGAGVFAFVFGKVARLDSGGAPYFVFSYAGLLGWMLFANIVTKSCTVLIQNTSVITKVYFPRLLLPLSVVLSSLLDFAVALAMMGVLLAIARIGLTERALLLPVWILILLALAVGCGLIAGALSVRYRDVPYITPVVIQFLTYGSPVAYSVQAVPADLRKWLWLNPLSAPLEACRWSLLGVGGLNAEALTYSAVAAATLLVMGLGVFNRLETSFADVI
jgi:lipopolysaccharide transport system permease protein